jgi:putative flavoprotein involved in K+ transport
MYQGMAKRDAEFYSQLEGAGFELDFGVDGSGLFLKYLRRGSGYYIEVGASQPIIDGRAKPKSGQVAKITWQRRGDGRQHRAGGRPDRLRHRVRSMNGWLADLVSPEIADRVGKCWGYRSDTPKDPGPWEGELRNTWKPTNVPNLWIHGGNLHQSRHYSSYLALQLKSRMEGLETPVYELQASHHTP